MAAQDTTETRARSQELTRRTGTVLTTQDPIRLAEHFANSGFFKDATDLSKAVVKIAAGEELGLGPMGSMQGIHIIEGKPSLSANVLASLVKRHEAYDYLPVQITEEGAEIDFFQNGEKIGTSVFTMKDAERANIAGKQNFKRYPKAMMFARALSQGVRWYCPDVTAGSPAYVPEELGAEVDEDGIPVDARPVEPTPNSNGEKPQVTAEVVETIPEDHVNSIGKTIGTLGLSYSDIDLMLGACGIDALRAKSGKALKERIASLTADQAGALEVELAKEADRG